MDTHPRIAACAWLAGVCMPFLSAPAQAESGRLLASNCFQCHGTNGHSIGGIDRLAGMSAGELIGEMKEMRAKTPGNDIMKVHARAYTDAQLAAIAAYFASQR
jgi:cytochrome subunit of sulfide dehydrogenase